MSTTWIFGWLSVCVCVWMNEWIGFVVRLFWLLAKIAFFTLLYCNTPFARARICVCVFVIEWNVIWALSNLSCSHWYFLLWNDFILIFFFGFCGKISLIYDWPYFSFNEINFFYYFFFICFLFIYVPMCSWKETEPSSHRIYIEKVQKCTSALLLKKC